MQISESAFLSFLGTQPKIELATCGARSLFAMGDDKAIGFAIQRDGEWLSAFGATEITEAIDALTEPAAGEEAAEWPRVRGGAWYDATGEEFDPDRHGVARCRSRPAIRPCGRFRAKRSDASPDTGIALVLETERLGRAPSASVR